LLNLMLFWY